MQFSCEQENPSVWFQPVIDTSDSRVIAHQCLFGGNTARYSQTALRGISLRKREGPLLIDVSGHDPAAVLAELGERSPRIVCQFRVGDAALEALFLERVRDLYEAGGCQFALEVNDASSATIALLGRIRPRYVKLHQSMTRRIEDPGRASAVRRLVEFGDYAADSLIATGVRNQDTVENLWLLGVRRMQGDHFGLPAAAIFGNQNAQSRLVNPVWAL